MEDVSTIHKLIEETNVNVFLTGKAGTGKTTFLRDFTANTKKKCVITAPTGIAAMNAGGVTIHSFFKIPPKTFIPTTEELSIPNTLNIEQFFLSVNSYSKEKRAVLHELELLVIDEVSMLRADLLDMIDFALRKIRGISSAFGGVQILFIGDLHQLPPVVKSESESILTSFYDSPFFFSAKALQNAKFMTIELEKVYRQSDDEFIQILNSIRNFDVNNIDFKKLNARYLPDFNDDDKNYIYLCSHNYQADEINRKNLTALKGETISYTSSKHGEFKSQLPTDDILEIKLGAQVMFTINDSSYQKRFYNGQLAKVVHFDEDEIEVILNDSDETVAIKRHTWDQIEYASQNKQLVEVVKGTFEQFPIRLAWAITIHKSQGLTFDKVIIDAGKSFASGQVYVALSRCRSLNGIVLKSKITPKAIFYDPRIAEFQQKTKAKENLTAILEREKYANALDKIINLLDLTDLNEQLDKWKKQADLSNTLDDKQLTELYNNISIKTNYLTDVFGKFQRLIHHKYQLFIDKKINWQEITDKCQAAVNFFHTNVHQDIFIPFTNFYDGNKETEQFKAYQNLSKALLGRLSKYLKKLRTSYLFDIKMMENSAYYEAQEPAKSQKEENQKLPADKTPSYMISQQMFKAGDNLEIIAEKRNLALSTIYSHITKTAAEGMLKIQDLEKIIGKAKIKTFKKIRKQNEQKFTTLKEWKNFLPNTFKFNEIRLLNAFFNPENDI